MNLTESLLSAENGAVIDQIARSLNISPEQARTAAQRLVPLLSGGIERNVQQPGGLESLLGALGTGSKARYIEQPATLSQPQSIADGNAILGHIFGSKDVSKNAAGLASAETGLDSSLLRKMLPMLSTALMGILAQQMAGRMGGAQAINPSAANPSAPNPAPAGPRSSAAMDVLTSMLDSNKDGSVLDDVLNMTKKFF